MECGGSVEPVYGGRWRKARETFLRRHPLCAEHGRRGQVVAASVVDHIVPHRGDQELFWDRANWQALCKPCHDGWKQQLEKSGTVRGCDSAGVPIDPRHHWNVKGAG